VENFWPFLKVYPPSNIITLIKP